MGEEGYTALERRWARPTFDVCGIWGGYQGEGAKTVLPAKAGAKFSFRLVPNQSPEKITAALRRWLPEITPPGVKVELMDFHGSPGVMVPLESRYVAAAARAIEQAFGRAAGLHPRGRFDSHRHHVPRGPAGRRAAVGLGPGRRQRPQPQREVLAWPISIAASRPARGCGRSWGS